MRLKTLGLNINGTNPPVLAKFNSYRSWDNGTRWSLMNPSDGQFDFTPLVNWLDFLDSIKVKDLIFELGGTPQWLASQPNAQSCNYGGGCCSPPKDLNHDGTGSNLGWREWCRAVSQRFSAYPDFTVHFSPWNEFVRQPPYPDNLAWTGTNEQLVRLSEDARAILFGRGMITATGESAQKVLDSLGLSKPLFSNPNGKMLPPNNCQGDFFNKMYFPYLATPGASDSAEVMIIHIYEPSPENVLSDIKLFRAGLDSINLAKELWIGEWSWGLQTPLISPADYVTQTITLIENEVDRLYWYAYAWPDAPLGSITGLNPAGEAWNKMYDSIL
jgi:hypothetical protein